MRNALAETNPKAGTRKIQEALDPLCLFVVNINPEMRVKVAQGGQPELVEQGWRHSWSRLRMNQERPRTESRKPKRKTDERFDSPKAESRIAGWICDVRSAPLTKALSGLPRNTESSSSSAGMPESGSAKFHSTLARARRTLDSATKSMCCLIAWPAQPVTLRVQDENRQADHRLVSSFAIGRARFILRKQNACAGLFVSSPGLSSDGETFACRRASYVVEFSRGPESIPHAET